MNKRHSLFYLGGLFAVATLAALLMGPNASIEPRAAHADARGALPDIAGTWNGTWADTVFFVSGALSIDIQVDGDSYTATGTIDVSQINPLLGVLKGSGSGTATGSVLTGTFSATDLGTGQGMLSTSASGRGVASGSGTGTVTAPLDFGPFTFAGDVVGDIMVGSFEFTNPGAGKGVAALSRQTTPVETSTWSRVKDRFGDR